MTHKSIEDNILSELEQLKGLASRFKAAEDAYLKACSKQEEVIDTGALTENLETTFLQELVKAKEDIREERLHWMEKLEARLNAIIKGIEYKFITEGIPFENRQQLIQLKVKQEQYLKQVLQENETLNKEISQLKRQSQRNFHLFVGLLVLQILTVAGLVVFKLLTS